MAGDDFADMYDTFPKLPIARSWRWGVKSAVARFAREVSSVLPSWPYWSVPTVMTLSF